MHVPLRNGSYYHCCAAKRRHASGTENSCKEKSCAGREQAIGSMSPCAYWLARPLTAADLQRYPYWRCMALGGDSKVLESVSSERRIVQVTDAVNHLAYHPKSSPSTGRSTMLQAAMLQPCVVLYQASGMVQLAFGGMRSARWLKPVRRVSSPPRKNNLWKESRYAILSRGTLTVGWCVGCLLF
jgi:hypothetical protein